MSEIEHSKAMRLPDRSRHHDVSQRYYLTVWLIPLKREFPRYGMPNVIQIEQGTICVDVWEQGAEKSTWTGKGN
jgi:hypothetical protein